MNRPPSGFTLTEVMVSMGVMALFLTIVFQFLGSSNQRLSFSSDLFAAIHLGTKVRSDLGEEVRLNPAFLEMLHEYPEMTAAEEMENGRSWFFRWGIDRQAPFGIIDSRDGPAVVPSDGPLFTELKGFRVTVTAQRLESPEDNLPESHLVETGILLEWSDQARKKHEYRLPAQVFSPGTAILPEGLSIDQNELQRLIRHKLFPADTTLSLDQAADSHGCDRTLAFHAGRLAVMMEQVDVAIGTITAEIADLVKKRQPLLAKPEGKLVSLQMRIARRTEDGASLLYNVLAECGESWTILSQETDAARVGKIPAGPYISALKAYSALGPQIPNWIAEAGLAYEWLLQPGLEPFLTEREKEIAAGKRLETYRLLLRLRPGAAASFPDFLRREADRVAGRNPHLMKFFAREETLRQDPSRYTEAFPNLRDILKTYNQEIIPNGKKSPELIARHPQGGLP